MPVALHTEGVDRNYLKNATVATAKVALHTEGVDRNKLNVCKVKVAYMVALHTEGVDRNTNTTGITEMVMRSPSTRRAWIEIQSSPCGVIYQTVALHTEGVDRNVREP